MNSTLFMYTRIPLGDGVKMDPSTWYGVVKGGKGKNEVSKQRRGWAWGDVACTHAKLPSTPQYSSHSSPSTSHPPLFLALATRSASQRLLCINKYCSYPLPHAPPAHSTISWTTLLHLHLHVHLHLIIPTPHTCAVTAAPIKGSLVRSVYSTVLFTVHICAPCSHMMGPASGPFCP